MSDNEMIQRAHDLLVGLGAMCGGMEAKGALVWRHPGHMNQKVHGNRYGGYAATKESLRRLKDDKEAREKYKQGAREKQGKEARHKIKVGDKIVVLPESGKTVSGTGPRYGDKFMITNTGKSKRTKKNQYKVETDRQTYNVYDSLNPESEVAGFLEWNA